VVRLSRPGSSAGAPAAVAMPWAHDHGQLLLALSLCLDHDSHGHSEEISRLGRGP